MIRWGILGTAKIARTRLVPAIQAANNGVLHAIASRNKESAEAMGRQYDINLSFSSYEALLECSEVDAVYIPLPTSHHIEWTIKCLQAGKHVLCEKPIALKAREVDSVIAVREETGFVVSEAFMVTYHPQWLKVKALLAEGAIGALRHIQGVFCYYNKDPNNMRNQLSLGGGGLPDIGVYPTVTARFATGCEPLRAWANIERDRIFGTDIYANCQYDFGTFDMGFYCATQMAARQSMIFHGDKGYIELTAPFNAGVYEGAELRLFDLTHQSRQVWTYHDIDQYRLEVEAFGEAVSSNKTPLFSLEDSKANQAAIDALYESNRKGTWESV